MERDAASGGGRDKERRSQVEAQTMGPFARHLPSRLQQTSSRHGSPCQGPPGCNSALEAAIAISHGPPGRKRPKRPLQPFMPVYATRKTRTMRVLLYHTVLYSSARGTAGPSRLAWAGMGGHGRAWAGMQSRLS